MFAFSEKMKKITKIIGIAVTFLIISVGILYYIFNSSTYKILDNRKFPFRYFKDQNGNVIPIVALTAFFRSDEDKARYNEYIKSGIKVIGVTSYKSFPKKIFDVSEDTYHQTDDFDYTKNIQNWLCCFKSAESYGLTNNSNNLIDLSESDFYDAELTLDVEQKKYDFIYICNKDNDTCDLNGWNAINRNFELAQKCFPIMINRFGLRGLIVGRVGCGLEEKYGDKVEVTDFLPYHELQQRMRQSKFLFVPNIFDASPRVVAECLVKGVPVLMNSNILCGFKYINEQTGMFFSNEGDVGNALVKLMNTKYDTRVWWNENYGVKRSAIRLRSFLKQHYPDIISENITEVKFIL